MYNFLHPKLLPKVSTTAACVEGYEVTNLISNNPMVKSRGFLCFTSIKPPIEVDFQLICPISIHYITISTTLGTQKSIGVEILAGNNQTEFTPIAQRFYDETGVTFCNLRYYSPMKPPKNTNSNFQFAFLKKNLFRVFINTDKIKVRILRTERSVPCIASIEIWGTVSKSCSKTTTDTINKMMTEKTISTAPIKLSDDEIGSPTFEIPDDFKDALTFELMAIPMTLPSGHTVDQTTLEKCVMNDASYGRQHCDPFTGLCFTPSRKPKLNSALKSRIDMFLISNAHRKETYGLSRTSGRRVDDVISKSTAGLKQTINGHSVDGSRLNSDIMKHQPIDSLKKIEKSSTRRNIQKAFQRNKHTMNSVSKNIKGTTAIGISSSSIRTHLKHVGRSYSQSNSSNTSDINNHTMTSSETMTDTNDRSSKGHTMVSSTMNTHTMNSSGGGSSLEEAMARVINNSNFMCFTKEETTESKGCDKIMCSICNSSDNLYKIKCDHLYCRTCLLGVCKTLICSICNRHFNRDEVEKFHV